MKYWRGYLVAAILAAITWALTRFAEAHSVLVDMIYPYVTRLVVTSMSQWTGGMNFCLWQVLLVGMVMVAIVTVILMILLKWNFFQWLGWVLASISCVVMLHTVVYGLNQYASPLADDVRLEITDYTVSELNEATVFFRDKANALAQELPRDSKGKLTVGTFEELAQTAGDGFRVLAYDQAVSVFAGSTVPVKKLGWRLFYGGQSGVTVALTGEAAVNPKVPAAILPFAMCKEMSHRMSIYSESDAAFAAFLAGTANPSEVFQYSAYLMAYNYCYTALKSVPTSTAQACAAQADQGVHENLRTDLRSYEKFFGEAEAENNRAQIPEAAKDENSPISFSEYTGVADLLVNWYIQTYIVPQHVAEDLPFDPLDATQVDLTGLVNAKQ